MTRGEVPTAPRPSIGRIVIYREGGPSDEFSDETIVDSPAIVRGVRRPGGTNEELVDLSVFAAEGVIRVDGVLLSGAYPASATIGDEPARGTWRWPERV